MRSAYLALDPVMSEAGIKVWLMDFYETDKTMSLDGWKDQIQKFGFQKFFKEKHLMHHVLWYGGEDLEAAVDASALIAVMCEYSQIKSLAHFGKEIIKRPFMVGLMRNGLIMPIPQKFVSTVIDILTHRQSLWCLLYHKGKDCSESKQEMQMIEDIDKAQIDTSLSLEDIIKKANSGSMRDFLK